MLQIVLIAILYFLLHIKDDDFKHFQYSFVNRQGGGGTVIKIASVQPNTVSASV